MLVIDLVFCVGAIRDHREDDQTEMVLDQQPYDQTADSVLLQRSETVL